MEKPVDLHIHTTASDGADTPAQVVALASALGLGAIAVTDHDTVSGIGEAVAAGAGLGVAVIPGIELSADYRGREVHLLGLFIDRGSAALRSALDWSVRQRLARNDRMVAALAADGFDIPPEALGALCPGAVPGRPHLAEYLLRRGYVASIQEAFDRYLGEGRPYFRPRKLLPLREAVRAIRAAGGVAVIAHPLQYGYDEARLRRFLREGKDLGCQALEVYYPEHTPAQQAMLTALADELGLALSGGSDYHGARKPDVALGSGIRGNLRVPYSVLAGLQSLQAP